MEIDLILIIGLSFLLFIFLFLVVTSPMMINGDTYFYIFSTLSFVTLIILSILTYQRSKKNGASLQQQYVGKTFGQLCTSDAMCGSNKCVNKICVM